MYHMLAIWEGTGGNTNAEIYGKGERRFRMTFTDHATEPRLTDEI